MPRRKRNTGQNERRRKVRRKDGDDDDTLVISDSESDEEEEDCSVKLTPRAARRLGRERKAQVQEMTEEEMLSLALKLSKQEASSATEREQVEDDDMKKAIAESLQVKADVVRCSQASETSSKELQSRTAEKPDPDQDTVTSHVRCKLSFPSKDGEGSRSDDKVPDSQTTPLKRLREVSPLPSMPDLSQKTWSQPSPLSPTLPFVPSQESQSSGLVIQELKSPSPEDEPSQSDSDLPKSPVFLRNCSVKLNHVPCSNTSSFSVTSPDQSPNSPLPPKSPVFSKTDSKQCTKLTRDKFSDCTHDSSFTGAGKPPNTIQESTSHKNRDFSTRLSHSRKAQPSARVSVPGDDKQSQEAVKLQQVTDDSSRATSSHTASDGAPNSSMPLSADDRSMDAFTSHMVLHLSDEDDDEDVNGQIIPPSPVFPQDRASREAQPKLSPTQPCCSPPTVVTSKYAFQTKSPTQADSELPEVPRKSADARLAPPVERKKERLVSYYWGVPFCPKGQSPDDYTRVILTQLEVYEKSLKEAQRQLLHKVDWGLPVSPCPIERPHSRRLKRHRVPKLLEEDEEEEEEKEDKGRGEELKEKKKKDEWKEREESRQCLEEEAESGQHETYVVLSSPETQEELERKSPLQFAQKGSTHSAKPSRNPIVEDLSEDTLRQSEPEEHGKEVWNGSFDVETTVCPESQMTEDNTPELMVTSPVQPHAESDVMEVDEMMEPAAEADERMEQERPSDEQSCRESVPSQVECPMCTCLFPLSKIEIHAAYCDGTVEDQDQQDNLSQGSTRRTSMRRTPLEDVRFEKSEQREKCFLCSKFFTSKEYSHHVDQCIQQKTPKQGNGLLSALNRTETVHLDDSGAGPSNTTNKTSCGPADASVRPGVSMDPEAPGYYVSTSPIKSFTPISELTDCLINFRQQYSDRTSQRLGRKRKFKR